jgi:predicted CopG family antitoxin
VKTIQIDRDVYNYLISKAARTDEPPASILRRELSLPQPTETIEVDDDLYNYLLSKTSNLGEQASDILRRELELDEAPNPDLPGTVVFRIPAGTGAGPWNTRERAIVATVGDTLRIVNDDTVPHRLHTDGVPFPHPSTDIMPGQSAEFVLRAPFDPDVSQPLHDHSTGLNGLFWIRVKPRL